MSDNILKFPRAYNGPEVSSAAEVEKNTKLMKHYHIQETISVLAPMIFNQLEIAGFELKDENEDDIKHGALIVEALRSIMCFSYGIDHPFQKISEQVFIPEEDGEFGQFKMAEKLDIELKASSSED